MSLPRNRGVESMTVARMIALVTASAMLTAATGPDSPYAGEVRSKDGTRIAFECVGEGPELLIVHGGTGDRTRWTPLFSYLQRDFTVCAMDRRGHGQSADNSSYSLAREAEDIVAVVESRKRPVAVLGHSFGGVAAYEAAHLSRRIDRLLLYEPPVGLSDHAAILSRMEAQIAAGEREAATIAFFRDIVRQTPEEIASMRARPSWSAIVGSIEGSIRQDRALSANGWDAARARRLRTPTLLMIGSRTANPELRRAVENLAAALPNARIAVLEGQEHNAMDTDRPGLALVVRTFLTESRQPAAWE